MAQDKRHLTTEQLSAYLDKAVSTEEQAQWEAHLSTCPQCQQALASLRRTIALLHALPAPVLPRSFVLPVETAAPATVPQAAAPIPIKGAQRRLSPNIRRVLRTMSAIAAVIGAVFFLSGLGPALIHGGSASSTSGSINSSASSSTASNGASVPYGTRSAQNHSSIKSHAPLATITPTAVAAVQAQPTNTDNKSVPVNGQSTSSSLPTLFIFNLSSAAGRLSLGMLLVILGLMGIALFKRSA